VNIGSVIILRNRPSLSTYAAGAQEIFDELPDVGTVPLFFRAFFYCTKCGGVICSHDESEQINFSGTALGKLLRGKPVLRLDLGNLIRLKVAAVVSAFD
jgi:sulfate adenylyltransferase